MLPLTPGTADCRAGTWLGIPKTLWCRERGGSEHLPGSAEQGAKEHKLMLPKASPGSKGETGKSQGTVSLQVGHLSVWTHLPGRLPAAILAPRRPPTSARLLG